MTSPTSLPSFDPPPAASRHTQVLATLKAVGLDATVDADNDIQVNVTGQQLYLRTTDEGPGLLRVFGQWQIMDDVPAEAGVRLAAAHQVTASHALVKVNVFDDTLVVAVDSITPDGAAYNVLVPASIDAVLSAVALWHQLLTSSPDGASVPGAVLGAGQAGADGQTGSAASSAGELGAV